jgi:DNA-3-methyladenine glycosylase
MVERIEHNLPREFYLQPTIETAKALLGKVLIHRHERGVISGRIVETEAYMCDDPACHSSRGMTARNETMFGEPGRAYVYFIYGMYHCFNAVTAPVGVGEAVLVRALEPLDGVELMEENRGTRVLANLTSGPGKLCQALGVDRRHDGMDLTGSELVIVNDGARIADIVESPRVGITQAADKLWRFYIRGNEFVSRK